MKKRWNQLKEKIKQWMKNNLIKDVQELMVAIKKF